MVLVEVRGNRVVTVAGAVGSVLTTIAGTVVFFFFCFVEAVGALVCGAGVTCGMATRVGTVVAAMGAAVVVRTVVVVVLVVDDDDDVVVFAVVVVVVVAFVVVVVVDVVVVVVIVVVVLVVVVDLVVVANGSMKIKFLNRLLEFRVSLLTYQRKTRCPPAQKRTSTAVVPTAQTVCKCWGSV